MAYFYSLKKAYGALRNYATGQTTNVVFTGKYLGSILKG